MMLRAPAPRSVIGALQGAPRAARSRLVRGAWFAGMVIALAACNLAACNADRGFLPWGRSAGEHEQGSAQVGGEVVSTVDGAAIRVADVQALVAASGLSPRAALTRLQSQALLIGEAERRGYARDPKVQHVAEQARAQALLAHAVESVHATRDEIAAAYASQYARFHKPERRASSHVLAALPPDAAPEQERAARDFIAEAIRELTASDDPAAVMQELGTRTSPLFRVRVERLPEVANDNSFVEPFMHALFSMSAPGIVPDVVRTEYGFHAIYVRSIAPPVDATLEQATPELRAELEAQLHEKKLEELEARLRTQLRVDEDPQGQKAIGELDQ